MPVSVIVPTYNGARYLRETLESVVQQSYTAWELVVVDDGSKDESAVIATALAERDSRVRVVCQENGGIAAARNRGLAESRDGFELALFLDHDDTLEPDALTTLVGALEVDEGAVAAHGTARMMDADGRLAGPESTIPEDWMEDLTRHRTGIEEGREVPWPADAPTTFAVEVLYNRIFTVGQALARKAALRAATPTVPFGAATNEQPAGIPRPFDPSAEPCDDYDLWLRLTLRGRIAFVDHPVVRWRAHGTNTSRQSGRMSNAELLVRGRVTTLPEAGTEHRELMSRGIACVRRQALGQRLRWAAHCVRTGRPVQAAKQLRHAAVLCAQLARGR